MTASLLRARCVHIRRVFTAYGLPAEYALIELALIKQLKLAALGMFGRSVARLKRQLEACASLLLLFFLKYFVSLARLLRFMCAHLKRLFLVRKLAAA